VLFLPFLVRMKIVGVVVLLAAAWCLASAGSCSSMLHCKECEDSKNCKSCPEDYILGDDKVCRYNCSKYGEKCTSCTEEKCLCKFGEEWDMTEQKCVDSLTCRAEDGAACELCGRGFDLIDAAGACSKCSIAFGPGCAACSSSKCTEFVDGYVKCGAVAGLPDECPSTCGELFPGCKECSEGNTECVACNDGAELDGGACKYTFPVCESGKKVLNVNGSIQCGNCSSFSDKCYSSLCNSRTCRQCSTQFYVNAEGGCSNCSLTFPGCALCTADACIRCQSGTWILTPNGCINRNTYDDDDEPEESNAGMIVGIVIAVLVLVAIIVLAVYCVVTSNVKRGTIDPSFYEDDFEFKSMSQL